jgi:hypothetical protein
MSTSMSFFPVPGFSNIRSRQVGLWSSWAIAAALSAAVLLGFVISSPQFLHWFVLPVLVCGILTGKDATDWALGRVHTFDVMGVFGVFGYFFFFVAPLLHVHWDFWMWEVIAPPDWREWLGGAAILNAVGLIGLRTVLYLCSSGRRPQRTKYIWVIDFRVFPAIVAGVLIFTAILQSWVYLQAGGVSAFIDIFQESYQGNEDRFAGWGWIFMISESFPIIAAFAAASYARKKRLVPTPFQFATCLLVLFALEIYFGGLRGSRLNTAEGLFWAVGAYHYLVKPISRTAVLTGALVLLAFMYVYGFYKDGKSITVAFAGEEVRAAAERQSHRSMHGLILGDLGRADVQAYLLYKTVTDPHGFQRANGQTYVSALGLLIPQRFRPSSLVNKEEISSDLIWGAGVYTPGVIWSTRIYGLAGEAIINFGYFAVPIAFMILAFMLTRLQHWINSLHNEDARLLLVPFLTYLGCVWAVSSDLDNVVFSILKQGFIVAIVIVCSTKRIRMFRNALPRAVAVATA